MTHRIDPKDLLNKAEIFTSQKENLGKIQMDGKPIVKKSHKYIRKDFTNNLNDSKSNRRVIDIANDFLHNSIINKFSVESQNTEYEDINESDGPKELEEECNLQEIHKGPFNVGVLRSRQVNDTALGKVIERRTADSAQDVFKHRFMGCIN